MIRELVEMSVASKVFNRDEALMPSRLNNLESVETSLDSNTVNLLAVFMFSSALIRLPEFTLSIVFNLESALTHSRLFNLLFVSMDSIEVNLESVFIDSISFNRSSVENVFVSRLFNLYSHELILSLLVFAIP